MKKFDLRDILNRLKWDEQGGLEGVRIYYLSRGAEGNEDVLYGREIVSIGASGIQTAARLVPYHRIRRIVSAGTILFERD